MPVLSGCSGDRGAKNIGLPGWGRRTILVFCATNSNVFYLGILYGVGYIFYSSISFQSDYRKKFYYRLFNNRLYFAHLLFTFLVACFGLFRCSQGFYQETFFIAPFLFLLLLRLLDLLVIALSERHIIISTRHDDRPENYEWYIDGILSVIIIAFPLIACGHLMNKFRFGQLFI